MSRTSRRSSGTTIGGKFTTGDLFRDALRGQRGAFIGWSLGLVAYAAFTISLFPSIQGTQGLQEYLENLPEGFQALFGAVTDIYTLEGFLTIEYLTYLPLLLGVYAIIAGTRMLVGDEEEGTMDLVLAYPVTRTQVLAARAGALVLSLLGICFLVSLTLLALGPLFVDDPPLLGLFLAGLNAFPIAAVLAAVAVAASAALHRRRHAVVVSIVFLAASFLLSGFAQVVPWLHGWRYLSVFHYYTNSQAIGGSIDLAYVVVAMSLAALLFVGASLAFDRKDIGV